MNVSLPGSTAVNILVSLSQCFGIFSFHFPFFFELGILPFLLNADTPGVPVAYSTFVCSKIRHSSDQSWYFLFYLCSIYRVLEDQHIGIFRNGGQGIVIICFCMIASLVIVTL